MHCEDAESADPTPEEIGATLDAIRQQVAACAEQGYDLDEDALMQHGLAAARSGVAMSKETIASCFRKRPPASEVAAPSPSGEGAEAPAVPDKPVQTTAAQVPHDTGSSHHAPDSRPVPSTLTVCKSQPRSFE